MPDVDAAGLNGAPKSGEGEPWAVSAVPGTVRVT